jgi:hypothetical protein
LCFGQACFSLEIAQLSVLGLAVIPRQIGFILLLAGVPIGVLICESPGFIA